MIVTRPKHKREATFDLTPMIDVVLLLIIFFSLTSQFSETQGSAVELPRERGDARNADVPQSMVVDIDIDGRLSVMGKEYTQAKLVELLTRHGAGDPASPSIATVEVLVRADRRCRSSHLDALVKALAAGGIRQWKLATAGMSGSDG